MEWAATTSTIISIVQYLSAPADSRTYREFLPAGCENFVAIDRVQYRTYLLYVSPDTFEASAILPS